MKIFIFIICFPLMCLSSNKTPVLFKDLMGNIDVSKARPWVAPKYNQQKGALGRSVDTFSIPAGMEERVSFWMNIYSKYTTDQGVLHDSRHVNLVYESVDFTDIMENKSLNIYQKERQRQNRVKQAKKRIKNRLYRLRKYTSSAGLEGEDLRYWYMFAKLKGRNKFKEATGKNRLRFQLGQKDRFIKGIFYSGRYIQQIEKIFKEKGLPIELTRLPFVESSFNLKARSAVGASGIWQFMRYTARPYLKMNSSADERNDPIKSSVASAKLLRSNYKMLQSWPLAVTGYNHGPSGVRRMTRKFKTRELAKLIEKRSGRFGFASANFYASFLAAVEVEKRARKLLGDVFWDQPLLGKEIRLKKNISVKKLIKIFDGNLQAAKLQNPHLKRRVWKHRNNIARGNFIRVPMNKIKTAMTMIRQSKSVPIAKGSVYRVRRGDTLSGIARKFGIRVKKIMVANRISNPQKIRIGQKIYIPTH